MEYALRSALVAESDSIRDYRDARCVVNFCQAHRSESAGRRRRAIKMILIRCSLNSRTLDFMLTCGLAEAIAAAFLKEKSPFQLRALCEFYRALVRHSAPFSELCHRSRMAGLHEALSSHLYRSAQRRQRTKTEEALKSCLVKVIGGAGSFIVDEAHREGATVAVLSKLKWDYLDIDILINLMRCLAAVRAVLRREDVTMFVFRTVMQGIKHDSERVAKVLCPLITADVPLCNARFGDALMSEILSGLKASVCREQARGLLSLLKCLIGKSPYAYCGQAKESKIPSPESNASAGDERARRCGEEALTAVLSACARNPFFDISLLAYPIIAKILQNVRVTDAAKVASGDFLVKCLRVSLATTSKTHPLAILDALAQLYVTCAGYMPPGLVHSAASARAPAFRNGRKIMFLRPRNPGNEDVCPICLEGDVHHETSCGHVMHAECLRIWGRTQRSCPVCRDEGIDFVGMVVGRD